jgi:hypothetical protein
MKRAPILWFVALVLGAFLSSCGGDDQPRLEIRNLMFAPALTTSFEPGDTLAVSATLVADQGIRNVRLLLEPQEGDAFSWKFDGLFLYENPPRTSLVFDKLVDISETAEPGEYLFTIILTDRSGEQVTQERELTLEAP